MNKAISRQLPVFLEGELAVVLPEKVQKPLVLVRIDVEEPRHDLVVAACVLEAAPDQIAHVAAGDLASHVERMDETPERLMVLDELPIQLVGERGPALLTRPYPRIDGAEHLRRQI